jgi:uroporphyrinogen decarboxylase
MTHLERIDAVMAGLECDRPPYGVVTSLYGARAGGYSLDDYYTDPQLYVRGQAAVDQILAPDILFGPFLFAYHAAAFGAELALQHDGAPTVRRPPFRSVSEAVAMDLPDIAMDRWLSFLVDAVSLLAERFGHEHVIVAPIVSPVDLPVLLVGMEAWLEALLFDKPAAAALAERMIGHFKAMADAYFKAGAQLLASPMVFASPEILDDSSVRTLTLPILARAFGSLSGPIALHHGGLRMAHRLQLFADLPNLAGYILGEQDSFAEARQILGDGPLLMGNISGPHFDTYGPEGVRQRLAALARNRQGDRRWICTSSGAELPYGTDPAVLTAVRTFFMEWPG